jgi:hypothetical protein
MKSAMLSLAQPGAAKSIAEILYSYSNRQASKTGHKP